MAQSAIPTARVNRIIKADKDDEARRQKRTIGRERRRSLGRY
jgi:hypothetical protein